MMKNKSGSGTTSLVRVEFAFQSLGFYQVITLEFSGFAIMNVGSGRVWFYRARVIPPGKIGTLFYGILKSRKMAHKSTYFDF